MLPLLRKAQENYMTACEAWGQKRYDVAASRFYYAVYQAGKQLTLLITRERNKRIEHGDITKFLTRFAAESDPCPLVPALYDLRCRADYFPEPVRREQLECWVEKTDGFLCCMLELLQTSLGGHP